jgi:hypothetical protein
MTFNCPKCNQVGFHKCKTCGTEITSEDCEQTNGLCNQCYEKYLDNVDCNIN